MITNERQYRIAKAELRRFEESAEAQAARQPSPGVDPRIHAAMGEALASEAEELARQIQRYEDLRDGRISEQELESLRDVPVTLIEARIAARLTQKALAERLGLPEQQIQRWESTLYSGVGVDRLQDIAEALDVEIRETVNFGVTA